jgi:hypothetical protein
MPATYEPIATTTLGSAAANIEFTSIGSGYTDLRLVFVGYSVNSNVYCQMQFNTDTGSNYSVTTLRGNGSAATSSRFTSQTFIYLHSAKGLNTAGNNRPSMLSADIFSYAGSTNKTVLTTCANDDNGDGSVERNVGLWRSTAAITSIKLFLSSGNFASGATATLYGILKA